MHIWGMFSLGSSGKGSQVLIGAQREWEGMGRARQDDGRRLVVRLFLLVTAGFFSSVSSLLASGLCMTCYDATHTHTHTHTTYIHIPTHGIMVNSKSDHLHDEPIS
jgi:hypothetical protein